jgi:uncharacterized protein (TIGR02266 family)
MPEEATPSGGSTGSGPDKRRFPRAPLQLLIQHRFNSMDEFVEKWSSDISMGGLFLRTEAPREEGAMIYLQFELTNGDKLIEGLGRVVRSQPPQEGRVAGMGIEFVSFDDESLTLIEELVTTRVRRHTPAPPPPA